MSTGERHHGENTTKGRAKRGHRLALANGKWDDLPMRGQPPHALSVDLLTRTLLEEFPELDATRLRGAVERGVARAASASLDTEGYRVVDLHLQRAEATEESSERAQILRELAANLEERGDAERALVVQLAAFGEVAVVTDLDPLLRLARLTERWSELPLETMVAMIDVTDDASARRLGEIATAWEKLDRGYYAADCLERVLLLSPTDAHANESRELFYRTHAEWPVLIDLLGRRAVHVVVDRERAELFREIGQIYERELDDSSGAFDAYQEADRLEPDRHDVLDALARLAVPIGLPEDEALAILERLAAVSPAGTPRARVYVRAAEVANELDKAQQLYERALTDDPELVPAIDGLAILLRDRGQFGAAADLLTRVAERAGLATERSRWLTDAADFVVALGETERAKELYRAARAADPTNDRAGVALVELYGDSGALGELVPILDELCRTTDEPARLRGYLLQRSKIAQELGDHTGARQALSRAMDLDPHDLDTRHQLGERLFEAGAWGQARETLEGLIDHEDLLQPGAAIELHFRIARCSHELGDRDAAAKHADIALALDPAYRPALLLRSELDSADPFAHAAHQLALANIAPPDEKAIRFAALGDRYAELGDPATAREMYREALAHRPGDHLLLTKFLGLVTEDGDWSYSLDIVQRLIDTESDPKVRARYRHLAGMIARDELDRVDQAETLLGQAVEDDPRSFAAADELERMLDADHDKLMSFYYRRLEQVRNHEGRPGERLRLWDRLGELCLRHGSREDALTAFEVALSLAPDDLPRRQRLADLYVETRTHDTDAIALHQAILGDDKRRIASYQALRELYERTTQPEKAHACEDALDLLATYSGMLGFGTPDKIRELFGELPVRAERAGATRRTPLGNEDWLALTRLDVDVQLSGLFALVAPAFAAERARMRPPPALPARDHEIPKPIAIVLARVVAAFGLARPPVDVDREQLAACKLALRVRDGVLVPVLVLGQTALDGSIDPTELEFVFARLLADLRNDRIARLLCPRGGELAQIIELAVAPQQQTNAARWLSLSLHPMELDQTRTIGGRLRERGVQPLRDALGWLAATERSADRIGFVVTGDRAICARDLEREPAGEPNRIRELVWASVTEELLGVRGRIEGWGAATTAAATSMSGIQR
ncbi:MAG: tetratricopeptide repeat protein [Kofleriaceae bacterium]